MAIRRFALHCALTALLAGCAPTMAPLPVAATAEDRQRAEVCHTRALEVVETSPGLTIWKKPTTAADWIGLVPTPERVAGMTLFIVSAPVWYPIMKSRHDQRSYDAAFDRCMIHGPAALAPPGASICYQELVREGPAFCTGDITGFDLPEPDSHWMVRR